MAATNDTVVLYDLCSVCVVCLCRKIISDDLVVRSDHFDDVQK